MSYKPEGPVLDAYFFLVTTLFPHGGFTPVGVTGEIKVILEALWVCRTRSPLSLSLSAGRLSFLFCVCDCGSRDKGGVFVPYKPEGPVLDAYFLLVITLFLHIAV